ncbi:hypothetical protein GBAR_LOCUS19983 [Geodia barretti]|uniref:SAM domain-containing protein n=1 Tax=Geodia barretti TaxID=519541 RepID=A0AA35SU01_GEOBA|nr:hypothetical protein GBAR_LOCUS19983 [Geodia barretti]
MPGASSLPWRRSTDVILIMWVLAGFSLGANIGVRFIGERVHWRSHFLCAVSVCQDYDPNQSSGMTETNDITITSQDTLQSLLARVGLTEHMELFQSNEIDLEALLLMSDKDFSEIGLPQAAQTTLMNSLGRRTPSAVREEGVASSAADQGDGRGFPSGSRQQEDSL